MKGLVQNGVRIHMCNVHRRGRRVWWTRAWSLVRQYQKIAHEDDVDVLVVGYSDSRYAVPLARLLSKKPLVWDAFYSLYDSRVHDRKWVARWGGKAAYYWFLDWLSVFCADRILVDTNAHADYFARTFGKSRRKYARVFVGTDDALFSPREKRGSPDRLLVHFHGRFVPLQGVPYIVKAAAILKNEPIRFQVIGKGQEYRRARSLAEEYGLRNIEWKDHVPYGELADWISRADIVLGVFGDTSKTQRVIPNKVYEAVACGKPVISADTPAIRELFTNEKDILLCKSADERDLAQAILRLRDDHLLRKRIAEGGYALFAERTTPCVIGRHLLWELGKTNEEFKAVH